MPSPLDGIGFAVGALDAELRPFVERRAAFPVVEALRDQHLEAPGQAVLPAFLAEIVAGRADHVRHVAPDVALAVAGEVDGVVHEVLRHELGLAHGAGPGADELVARDALVLQDFQRDQQFVAEVVVAVLGVGERRQRADRVPFVLHRAVGRFHSPDRQDDPALDLEALLHRRRTGCAIRPPCASPAAARCGEASEAT